MLDLGRKIEQSLLVISMLKTTMVKKFNDQVEYNLQQSVLMSNEGLVNYRYKYRRPLQNLLVIDLLIFDDAQFLQGRVIQAEFGHALNALVDAGRQVVVAADRPPGDLESLEERVRSGRGAVAFSMFPTSLAEVMAIADAGATMPPKSTWFEPKLRSGLFVHRF